MPKILVHLHNISHMLHIIYHIYIYCIYIYIYHISGQIIRTSLFSLTGIIVVVGDSPRACTTETDSAEKPAAEVANFIHQHVKETNGIFFKILPLTSISILCRHYIYIYVAIILERTPHRLGVFSAIDTVRSSARADVQTLEEENSGHFDMRSPITSWRAYHRFKDKHVRWNTVLPKNAAWRAGESSWGRKKSGE